VRYVSGNSINKADPFGLQAAGSYTEPPNANPDLPPGIGAPPGTNAANERKNIEAAKSAGDAVSSVFTPMRIFAAHKWFRLCKWINDNAPWHKEKENEHVFKSGSH